MSISSLIGGVVAMVTHDAAGVRNLLCARVFQGSRFTRRA